MSLMMIGGNQGLFVSSRILAPFEYPWTDQLGVPSKTRITCARKSKTI